MSVLEISELSYRYKNSRENILLDVNQTFELGQFYAIIGSSGVGKSTLLSLLAGLDEPQEGNIYFKNEDIKKKVVVIIEEIIFLWCFKTIIS